MVANFFISRNPSNSPNRTLAEIINFPYANAEFVKTCETGYIPNKDEYYVDGYQDCKYDYADCCKNPN